MSTEREERTLALKSESRNTEKQSTVLLMLCCESASNTSTDEWE